MSDYLLCGLILFRPGKYCSNNEQIDSSSIIYKLKSLILLHVTSTDPIKDDIPCQGLYYRKFEILFEDGNAGATSAIKMAEKNDSSFQ